MKKLAAFVSVALLVAFMASAAYADVILTGELLNGGKVGTQFYYTTNGSQNPASTAPWVVTSGSEQHKDTFFAFCGDLETSMSAAFSGTGQEYKVGSLSHIGLERQQIQALTTLFSHTYSAAFSGGSVINANVASAIQAVTWEIINEPGIWGMGSGNVVFNQGGDGGPGIYAQMFLSALQGERSWDLSTYGLGNYTTATHYDYVAYYTEGDISQPLIRVVGGATATPEPATLLILGLGALVGLPLVTRRSRKNAA
ncbi:MAG: PEP-CTERM sorting domain-containing protein [Thermoguttaceae bacterium]